MTPTKELTSTPKVLSHADMMALLHQSGMTQASSNFRRMKLEGGTIVTLDGQGEIENQYPPRFKGKEPLPALTVRIVEPPVYYNSFWLDADESRQGFDAGRIGRPDLNKSFSKKYDDPSKQTKTEADELFDEIAKVSGSRGKFGADMKVQIVPDDGVMTGNETVYTLTLSTTATLDWRGTSRNPEGGIAQGKNFIVQLAEFAMTTAANDGMDEDGQKMAVLNAMTALRLGGVVADLYCLRLANDDSSLVWYIPAFKPVHVEYATTAAALPDPGSGDGDEVPF